MSNPFLPAFGLFVGLCVFGAVVGFVWGSTDRIKQALIRRARRLATGARDGAAVRNAAHALPLRSVQPRVVTAAAHRSFKLVKGDIA